MSSGSTSSSPTLTSSPTPKSAYTPDGIDSGSFSSSLIIDGSRAIDAICRPYAIAIVGLPIYADFDYNTSVYKLTVKVSANDVVPKDVATEIYLPFVHYASNLDGSEGGKSDIETRSQNTSRVSLVNQAVKEKVESESRIRTASTASSSFNSTSTNLELGVDTKVSTGRTEINGQTLKWYYAPPDNGERTYTLEVKRVGGAIARSTGYGGGTGSWADVCPPSCVLA